MGAGYGGGWGGGWGGGGDDEDVGGVGDIAAVPESLAAAEVPSDLTGQALGRVPLQYQDSTTFLRVLAIFTDMLQDVEAVLTQIPQLDDPTVATGVNLDVDGDLVGRSRTIPGSTPASDSLYALMILAQIGRNSSHCTNEDIIGTLGLLLNNPTIMFFDWGDMAIGYAIGRPLTTDEVDVLSKIDILARTMGCLINPRETYDPVGGFFFDTAGHGLADDSSGSNVGGGTLAAEF